MSELTARLIEASRQRRPLIMAILNTTPDSFSDGGSLYRDGRLSSEAVLARCERLIEEGADLIDVGGESTRPGAHPVGVTEELERVVPVVEAITSRFDVAVSVDTSSPEVMTAAATAGAALINDVRALTRPGALEAALHTGLPVLVGVSRKSMVGQVLDRPVDERVHGSVALALMAAQQGAALVRVHDVAATHDALVMHEAVLDAQSSTSHLS